MERRQILKLAGCGTLMAGTSGLLGAQVARANAGSAIDYDSNAGRLKTVLLMRGALDDRLVINWIRARYFGVIGDEMTPLFGVIGVTFNRFRPMSNGGYAFATHEIAYFTDHDVTQAIDTYENPYTGETVTIPEGGVGASLVHLGPGLEYALAEPQPAVDLKHTFYPIHLDGEDVWLTESENVALTLPGGAVGFRYQDVATYHAPRAALEAPDAVAVQALVGYSGLTSWRPWLKMPVGTPGHLSSFGSGRTNSSLDAIPTPWLDAVARKKPEVLENPGGVLDEVWDG